MIGQWTRALGGLVVATLLTPGCLSVLNHVAEPTLETLAACDSVSPLAKNSVYVVLVNGIDPLECGNLSGVRDQLNALGFVKTYYAQVYHEKCLIEELKAVHAERPDARFAIVGFEYGALPARGLALKATAEGLPVDLVVYLQPKGGWMGGSGAEGVARTIAIRAGHAASIAAPVENSDIVDVPCFSRYGVPTHPNTLALLATELTRLASGIAVPTPTFEPFPTLLDDPAPPPRPVVEQPGAPTDEWDFLKPTARRAPAKLEPDRQQPIVLTVGTGD
jgi:hypothetical protein